MEENPISAAITAITAALDCGVPYSPADRQQFYNFIGMLTRYEGEGYHSVGTPRQAPTGTADREVSVSVTSYDPRDAVDGADRERNHDARALTPGRARQDMGALRPFGNWLEYPERDDDDELTGGWALQATLNAPDHPLPLAVVLAQGMPKFVAEAIARLPLYVAVVNRMWSEDTQDEAEPFL